ncbi:hypothetical protein PG985_013237 [Apiospora marii]|uniref:Uncharacterized protein n=1 Tax=Apiospora marii TaxID=335849 RepID=A0ABR1R9D3_9PEZI
MTTIDQPPQGHPGPGAAKTIGDDEPPHGNGDCGMVSSSESYAGGYQLLANGRNPLNGRGDFA